MTIGLPKSTRLTVKIYDVTGKIVKTLADKTYSRGVYTFNWDGTDDKNNKLPPGIFFYQIKTNNTCMIKKVIKLR